MSIEKNNIGKQIAIEVVSLPIHFYRYVISPLTPAACRHIPTCSEYSLQALKKYGLINGSILAGNRIARCNPWGTQGFDPVPDYIFPVFIKMKPFSKRLKPIDD